MIKRIMKHEWTLLWHDKVVYVALPIYALLLAYGVMTGTAWKNVLAKNTAEAVRLADEGFASKVAKVDRILAGQEVFSFAEDPRLAAPLARFKGYEMAAKPPSPTGAIAVGQSDVVVSYQKVQWKPMFKQTNTDEIENPKNLAVGALDLGFILIYLYPLLIIALSYNILSSERENGTQALLLSQPVSVSQFVLGKILLRGIIVVGLAAGISLVGLLIANPDILSAGATWRVGLLTVILALYGAFWFGLAVLVNALGQKSATNALVMIGVWLGLVLILPSAVNLVAKSAYPLPSRIELVQAVRASDGAAEKESNFSRTYRADLLRKGEEEALEASTTDFYQKVLPLEQRAEEIAKPIFDKFKAQRLAQQELAERGKYLSPAAVTQIVLGELANHSAKNFNDFDEQVLAYQKVWRAFFLGPVLENRLLTPEEMRAIPRFKYVPEPDNVVFKRVLADILALLVYAGVVFAAGFVTLRGYQPGAR